MHANRAEMWLNGKS